MIIICYTFREVNTAFIWFFTITIWSYIIFCPLIQAGLVWIMQIVETFRLFGISTTVSIDIAIKLVICRIFIPFRKDEMKGTVVQLDRGSKSRGGRWLQDIICKIQKMDFYLHHVWQKIFIVKGLDWRNSGKEEMRERSLEWLRSRYELE